MAGNGMDQKILRSFVERIENVAAEIDSERGSFMQKCKALRDDIAIIYTEAAEKDIPTKELKTLVKTRRLERKIDATINALEPDERATFEMLEASLGEFANTPLGQATLDRARKEEEILAAG